MPAPRRFVAGNWKMNGVAAHLDEVRTLIDALGAAPSSTRVAIFPPATLVHRLAELAAGGPVEVGAQDVHADKPGAHTGDLAAELLHDAGARLVIIGHSERRTDHRESDAVVAAKVEAALRGGLEPVICVGETLEERKAGRAEQVVEAQLQGSLPDALDGAAFSVAYEPVWAIGTGLTPTLEEIGTIHSAIRTHLVRRFKVGAVTPILYGGSVKPGNAAEILAVADVDGALVGGASLTTKDFLPIVRAGG
ncbi:MAG: triose-phosphate isomerase [Pseudomonadota bacterium]|jgi:triosephosphate isomerase